MTRTLILLAALLSSCCCPQCPEPPRFELGSVQREIRVGMSQTEVATALGTPNIVTTDKAQKEAWIYDKVATDVREENSSTFLILFQGSRAARTTSQRTLTVIIKFNTDKQVESISYHSSKF